MNPTTSFRGFQSSVATLGIALAGCADPAPTPHELGIAKIERTESPTELTLVGVDAQGGEIARVHLRLGLVDMSSEDRGVLDGREMTAEVLGKLATHQSAGRGALNLPLPRDRTIQLFLRDPNVYAPLARWGVGLDLSSPLPAEVVMVPSELAYLIFCSVGDPLEYRSTPYTGATACTYTQPCGSGSCIQWTAAGSENGQYKCCATSQVAAERRCTTANTQSSCGLTGGNGCAPCWSQSFSAANGGCATRSAAGTAVLTFCP